MQRFLTLVATCAVIAFATPPSFADEPPSYGGHDVHWWIERMQSRQHRAAASAALHAMGVDAIPAVILAYVGENNRHVRRTYMRLFEKAPAQALAPLIPHVRRALAGKDEARRYEALRMMPSLGAAAHEMLGTVVDQLSKGRIGRRGRSPAFQTLMRMGAQALPLVPQILAQAVRAEDVDRIPYAQLLLSMGPKRPETEGYVTGLLEDADAVVRERVLEAIRDAGNVPAQTRARWTVPLMQDDVPRIRVATLRLLRKLPEARDVWLDAVLEGLNDPSKRVREAAFDIVLADEVLADRSIERIIARARALSAGDREAFRDLGARLLRLKAAAMDAIPVVLALDRGNLLDSRVRIGLRNLLAAESTEWAIQQLRDAPPDRLTWLSDANARWAGGILAPPASEQARWVAAALDRLEKHDLPQPIVRGLLQRIQTMAKDDKGVHARLLDLGARITEKRTLYGLARFLSQSKWRDELLATRWMAATDQAIAFFLQVAPHVRQGARLHYVDPGTKRTAPPYAAWLSAKSEVLRDLAAKALFHRDRGGTVALPHPSEAQRTLLREYLDRELEDGDEGRAENLLGTPLARLLLGDTWGPTVLQLMDSTEDETRRRRLSYQLTRLDTARRRAVVDLLLKRMGGENDTEAARATRALSWMASLRTENQRTEAPYLDALLAKIATLLPHDSPQVHPYAREAVGSLGKLAERLEKELFAYVAKHERAPGPSPLVVLVRVFPDREDVRKRVLALWKERDKPGWREVPMLLLTMNSEWAENAYVDLVETPDEDGSDEWWAAVGNVGRRATRPGVRIKLREKLIRWQAEAKPGSSLAQRIETYLRSLPR